MIADECPKSDEGEGKEGGGKRYSNRVPGYTWKPYKLTGRTDYGENCFR